MNVRSFDWRDLPSLYRYRRRSIFLDSALVLTRGPLLMPGALLSTLAPPMGIFTSVSNENSHSGQTIIGQVIIPPGSQFAHLTFLTPAEALDEGTLPDLLEHLTVSSCKAGALRLLADADEHSHVFDILRQSSFAIYARQRIWQLTGNPGEGTKETVWRRATAQDAIAIRSLHNLLVPGLVQQVETQPTHRPRGLIFRKDGELRAYVELKYGHRGVWVLPLVHPDALDIAELFTDLLENLPYRRSRPVYVCVRSYVSWLEPAIEELGAEAGPPQALMVRHLALPQKSARMFALPALEGGHPEVTAPIARSEIKQ